MRIKKCLFLSLITLTLFLLYSPRLTQATTLTVSNVCSASSTTCFTSLTAAISVANITTTDNIVVEPGTYTEPSLVLKNNLPITGRETAKTIVQNTGTGPVFQATGLSSVSISKLTIICPTIGIQAVNSSVHISNNIFWGNSAGTAIQLQGTSSGEIFNNTFFQNQTAISSTADIEITNNIFSGAGKALSAVSPIAAFTIVNNNDFHNDQTIGFTYDQTSTLSTNIPNGLNSNPDPKFVNSISTPPEMDLHLQEGSPCIDTGSTAHGANSVNGSINGGKSDIGAFGGSGSDTIPFIVSGVSITPSASDAVTVNWSPNKSYVVTNTDPAKQGGYNVYFNLNKSGPPYDNKATVVSAETTTVISGLTSVTSKLARPVLNEPGFSNQTLIISWSPVSGATKYFLHYTDLVTSVTTTIDVGNTTSFTIGPPDHTLVNLRDYQITVSAVAQATYHFSVTAFDYTVVNTDGGTPGQSHESDFSPEILVSIGTSTVSDPSDPKTAFPEAIEAHPNLPNKGCFIATAAYGYYSAPQVQALREFRDRYLVTNSLGRAFVAWYYHYGPIGADFMNRHDWTKPLVRVALMPAVAGALFMTHTTLYLKIVVILITGMLFFYFIRRRMLSRSGGMS